LLYSVENILAEPNAFIFHNASELNNFIFGSVTPGRWEAPKEFKLKEHIAVLDSEPFLKELMKPFYSPYAIVYGDFCLSNFTALNIKALPPVMFKPKLCRLAYEVTERVFIYRQEEYVFFKLPTKDFDVYLIGYSFKQ